MTALVGPGRVRLYRLESLEADGSVQVSTGIGEDLVPVVLLRVGLIILALDPAGIPDLAEALLDELGRVPAPPPLRVQ